MSTCLYRRPCMAALNAAFHLVDAASVQQASSKIISLPRRVADELVLVSELCRVIVADIAAPWSEVLDFASLG